MVYHPERLFPGISILLQIQPTPAFSLDDLDFRFVSDYARPSISIYYIVRCGVETATVKIVCVNSLQPCGPRSNLDLTHFTWTTFSYYCTSYATVMLPSQTLGDRILYDRQ